MRFIFADSLDMIDPAFDFDADRMSADREQYWSDVYPHEFFPKLPYDGVLVSRGVVGDDRFRVRAVGVGRVDLQVPVRAGEDVEDEGDPPAVRRPVAVEVRRVRGRAVLLRRLPGLTSNPSQRTKEYPHG